jgi:translation initiation factor IF-2
MSEVSKSTRLGKAAQEFNVGMNTIVEFLHKKGIKIDNNANTKLTPEAYALLVKEYQSEKTVKEVSKKIELEYTQHKTISISDKRQAVEEEFEPEVTREELFIRNMPLEPEKVSKPQPVKEEKPVAPKKEAVHEPAPEVKTEPEPVVPAQPVVSETEKPEEKHVTETPPVEITRETTPVPPSEPVEAVHKPEAAVETPAEEIPSEPADQQPGQLKVLGKMDLDSLHRPASRKSKDTRKKEKHPEAAQDVVEEKQAETPAAVSPTPAAEEPVAQPAAEVAEIPAVEEKPEVIETPPVVERESNFLKTEVRKLEGPTILGSMKLPEPRKPEPKKPVASSSDDSMKSKKKKRKRIKKAGEDTPGAETTTGSTPTPSGQGGGAPRGKPSRDRKGARRDIPKPSFHPKISKNKLRKPFSDSVLEGNPKLRNTAARNEALPAR